MTSAFTITELQEIISTLKEALLRAAASGGVTSYTLKSGQGESTVQQASIAVISNQIQFYTGLLNEITAIETGSSFTVMRNAGF